MKITNKENLSLSVSTRKDASPMRLPSLDQALLSLDQSNRFDDCQDLAHYTKKLNSLDKKLVKIQEKRRAKRKENKKPKISHQPLCKIIEEKELEGDGLDTKRLMEEEHEIYSRIQNRVGVGLKRYRGSPIDKIL